MQTTDKQRTRAASVTLALMLLAWPSRAFALNPALDVSQYAHTTWKVRDGFSKGYITAIAQTADGYLWLGSELGLLRFDGVRAVAWQPPAGHSLPSNYVRSLLAAKDGTLWIGTLHGLASWKNGTLIQHPELAGQAINTLLEDRDGVIWIGGQALPNGKLCAFHAGSLQCDAGDGSLGSGVFSIYQQKAGTLWVSAASGLWRWKPGPPTPYRLSSPTSSIENLAEDNDGALLIGTFAGIRRLAEGKETAYTFPGPAPSPFVATRLRRDRDGGLWIGTTDRGLAHVHDGRTDVFARSDGLSGDFVNRMFEDREGNMWVTTTSGLDRFRELAIPTISVKQGLLADSVFAVEAANDDSVWIATRGGLNRWKGGRVASFGKSRLQTILQNARGRLWASTADGLVYLENNKTIPVYGAPRAEITSIVEDSEDNLWIASLNRGLIRVAPPHYGVQEIPWKQLGHDDPPVRLAADRLNGGIWLGFLRGGIVYFEDGQVRASYTAIDGLAPGRIADFHLDPDGTLWVAAEGGLSRLQNGRVATLTGKNGLPCDAVHWVISDDIDSFWLYMACGLVRIARSSLEAWGSGSVRSIAATIFDGSDGVELHGIAVSGYDPNVAKASDGRLWFVSGTGVSIVDPRRIPFNNLPPPVHIEQVVADRTPYDANAFAGGALSLPALTRDLQIDYTALSFVAPEKMRFRYKLEGHDRDWQDVGTRRQAFYNDLPPGNYRFRVTASNNSGVWNEAGTFVDFSVAPAYYQTTWFAATSTVAVIALVWTAYRVRVRIIEKHQGEISALNDRLMKAQEQERIRIAGEIHDGVMQEMLAATMMLGTAKRRIPEDSEAKASIDKVQQKLIRAGTDLRQLSHDLHPPLLQDAGLPAAVNAYCEQFSATWSIPVSCVPDDSVRDLSRGAALALFRILQEALGNAAKHAAARQIIVGLTRSDGMVSLTVSDDGVGLDRGQLASGGGLGLIMMRERATQLNGTFECESAPGRGTTIKVIVPFR